MSEKRPIVLYGGRMDGAVTKTAAPRYKVVCADTGELEYVDTGAKDGDGRFIYELVTEPSKKKSA